MVDEHGGRALEMTRVHDQQQVETLRSDSANEPFGDPIRFRYLNRRAKDSGALGLKHSVKAAREFAIVIAKQKANGLRALSQGPRHLPRLLGDPVPVGMGLAARCTRRLAISMKNGTYNRWNQTVSLSLVARRLLCGAAVSNRTLQNSDESPQPCTSNGSLVWRLMSFDVCSSR
jgi:hypothetical protein